MSTHSDTVSGTDILQLVSFCIGSEEYGVDIHRVQEINRTMEVTRVPNSPPYVEGVINLRGRVIPVIDLRARFGMSKKEWDKDTRIIVVEIQGVTVGFVVDSVNEVLRIPRSVTEPPPIMASGGNTDYITGIGKLEDRLLILLDLDKLVGIDELKISA